jgi:hypothetical protein
MGWIVFEEDTGRAVKYYKSARIARAQVTRHNGEIRERPAWYKHSPYSSNRDRVWLCCSYADYEGVLMGMKEPERKMWAFCRGSMNG